MEKREPTNCEQASYGLCEHVNIGAGRAQRGSGMALRDDLTDQPRMDERYGSVVVDIPQSACNVRSSLGLLLQSVKRCTLN